MKILEVIIRTNRIRIKMESKQKTKNKVVLVSGCAGFIGSHVAEELLKRGDQVIGIDELNSYYNIEQKKANLELLRKYDNFEFFMFDLADYENLKRVFKFSEITHVAHLAARAGVRPSIDNPFIYQHSNIKATLNLLDLAKDFGIENFALTSSSSVYGNRDTYPFNETDNVDHPISPYAATKKATELLAHTYHHIHKLNVNIIRPFTIYGPRGRPDMAPFIFADKISKGETIKRFGDGSSQRDYTFIDDFVEGFLAALDIPLGYEIFNLGNSTPVSLNEFISTIEEVVGKEAVIDQVEMPAGDVKLTYANISKAQKMLGYNPKTKLKEGIEKFFEWHQQKEF